MLTLTRKSCVSSSKRRNVKMLRRRKPHAMRENLDRNAINRFLFNAHWYFFSVRSNKREAVRKQIALIFLEKGNIIKHRNDNELKRDRETWLTLKTSKPNWNSRIKPRCKKYVAWRGNANGKPSGQRGNTSVWTRWIEWRSTVGLLPNNPRSFSDSIFCLGILQVCQWEFVTDTLYKRSLQCNQLMKVIIERIVSIRRNWFVRRRRTKSYETLNAGIRLVTQTLWTRFCFRIKLFFLLKMEHLGECHCVKVNRKHKKLAIKEPKKV